MVATGEPARSAISSLEWAETVFSPRGSTNSLILPTRSPLNKRLQSRLPMIIMMMLMPRTSARLYPNWSHKTQNLPGASTRTHLLTAVTRTAVGVSLIVYFPFFCDEQNLFRAPGLHSVCLRDDPWLICSFISMQKLLHPNKIYFTVVKEFTIGNGGFLCAKQCNVD